MRVFVETNFVLELVFGQEQKQACDGILSLAEADDISIVIPAFCLMEPYQRIGRRARDRTELQGRIERERAEVARVSDFRESVEHLDRIATFLISAAHRDRLNMSVLRARLLTLAVVVPLSADVIAAATFAMDRFGLSAEDAVVLESVRHALLREPGGDSLFLTRNAKDFRDPELRAELEGLRCEVMFDFEDAFARMVAASATRKDAQ